MLNAVFIDFKKAFDNVDRHSLFLKLQKLGIPFSFCSVISQILSNLKCSIRNNNALSDPFHTTNGVPQGDPISPILFSLYISDLPSIFNHTGVQTSNIICNHIFYADDTVIFSPDAASLQTSLNDLKQYCDDNNLPLNVSKTKLLCLYKGRQKVPTLSYSGCEIENVNEFCYLGVDLTTCLLYTSPSPRDKRQTRMPSSA